MKEDNEECEAINRRDARVARKFEENIAAENVPIPREGPDDELKEWAREMDREESEEDINKTLAKLNTKSEKTKKKPEPKKEEKK